MKVLTIPYSDDLLISSGKSSVELEKELRFLLAVKLFELRRISLGKAAEFCEMGKVLFMNELGVCPKIENLLRKSPFGQFFR